MRVCFDLRALQTGHENRGIGMYIRSLLEHLPASDNQYIFYTFEKNDPIKALGIKLSFEYELVQTATLNTAVNSPRSALGLIKLMNHRFARLKAAKPDVFVQFDFNLGLPRWPKVQKLVIGYDLIPLIKKSEYLPSTFTAVRHALGKRAKFRALVRAPYYRFKYYLSYKVFARADKVVCISKATAQSFHDLLGIPVAKLETIPLAPVLNTQEFDDSIVKKIKRPYLFYVGGTDSRKRVRDVLRAFHIAKGRGADIDLVLAGNEFTSLHHLPDVEARNLILHSPYKKAIHLVGFVSDAQKVALFRQAYAFVFCSTYEGFGLPIVEAMSVSCPVISYDNSSIPEAAGNTALLVETDDYVGVAHAILSLEDDDLRQKLVAGGLKQAAKFSWHSYVNAFSKLISNN